MNTLYTPLRFFLNAFEPVDEQEFKQGIESLLNITQKINSLSAIPQDLSELVADVHLRIYPQLHKRGENSEWDTVRQMWEIAIHIAERGATPEKVLRLMTQYGVILNNQGRDSVPLYLDVIQRAKAEPTIDNGILATAYFHLGAYYVDHGQNSRAKVALEACIRSCDLAEDPLTALYALQQLANATMQTGNIHEAIRLYQRCNERWTSLREAEGRAHVTWYGLGKAYILTGDYRSAVAALRKSLALKEATDPTVEGIANCKHQLGIALAKLDPCSEEAETYLVEAKTWGEQLGDIECIIHAYLGLADINDARQRADIAHAYLVDACRAADSIAAPLLQARTKLTLGRFEVHNRHFGASLRHFRDTFFALYRAGYRLEDFLSLGLSVLSGSIKL